MGSIYVDEERLAGDPNECWSARWELTVNGDTFTGTMTTARAGLRREDQFTKQK